MRNAKVRNHLKDLYIDANYEIKFVIKAFIMYMYTLATRLHYTVSHALYYGKFAV